VCRWWILPEYATCRQFDMPGAAAADPPIVGSGGGGGVPDWRRFDGRRCQWQTIVQVHACQAETMLSKVLLELMKRPTWNKQPQREAGTL